MMVGIKEARKKAKVSLEEIADLLNVSTNTVGYWEVVTDPVFKIGIKEARKMAGYTQSQIADFFGVSRAAISGWERGSFSMNAHIFIKMSEIYKIPLQSLTLPELENE